MQTNKTIALDEIFLYFRVVTIPDLKVCGNPKCDRGATMTNNSQIIIYQNENGEVKLDVRFDGDTVWLTQKLMSELFDCSIDNISLHLKNIFKEAELDENSVIEEYSTTALDGKKYRTKHYNLDAIISIGYRVNSTRATQFRIWATKTLKEHITKGYTINRKQIQKNYKEFLQTVESVQNLLPEHITLDPKTILELIKEFSNTWVSLDAYDKETLKPIGKTKRTIKLSGEELVNEMKAYAKNFYNKFKDAQLANNK